MMFAIFPIRIYQIVLFVFFVALVVTCIHRAFYYDEAWFAEQSYWLIHDGKVRSELFRGYNGWEKGIYVFHKLFVYAGALVMYVTGVSVATSKLVSIIFSLLGGYLVWLYRAKVSSEQRYLSILLYFGCGTLIRYIAINRPETMCMALGFASYLMLDPPNSPRPKPIVAGVFAGLAALTHLNGLIYLVAGTIWLFVKLGWRPTTLFAVAGALALSLYGLDALLDGNLTMLIKQFRDDPATQQNLNLADKLSVLADYHQIFFHSQNEAALSVLVILGAILFRKHIRFDQPVLFYTTLLFCSFWLLTKSTTDIYFLLFVPWLSILAANWLSTYTAGQPVWQQNFVRTLLVLYCLVALLQIRTVIIENESAPDIEERNALLARYMPHHHTKIIAPIGFFFGQMDNYSIVGLTYYYLLEREGDKIPLSAFFQRASQDNIMYIISDYGLNASYTIPANAPAQIGDYRRVFQDKWNTVYARYSHELPASTNQEKLIQSGQ